jgi:hypothetical protein
MLERWRTGEVTLILDGGSNIDLGGETREKRVIRCCLLMALQGFHENNSMQTEECKLLMN